MIGKLYWIATEDVAASYSDLVVLERSTHGEIGIGGYVRKIGELGEALFKFATSVDNSLLNVDTITRLSPGGEKEAWL